MKTICRTLLAALALCATATLATAQNKAEIAKTYQDGVAAFNAGDFKLAAEKFAEVQKYYPRDPKLNFYLRNARLRMLEGNVAKNNLEGQLQKLVIPNLEFEEADLDTVLKYLSDKTAELSKGEIRANFIYKGTDEERKAGIITLKLTNVPISEVIRYVGELSRTQFRYEAHAVVGIPKSQLAQENPVTEPEKANPLADFGVKPAAPVGDVFKSAAPRQELTLR